CLPSGSFRQRDHRDPHSSPARRSSDLASSSRSSGSSNAHSPKSERPVRRRAAFFRGSSSSDGPSMPIRRNALPPAFSMPTPAATQLSEKLIGEQKALLPFERGIVPYAPDETQRQNDA